jgi:hypothetical protein
VAVPLALLGSEAGHAAGNLLLGFPLGTHGELLQRQGPGAAHAGALISAIALVALLGFTASAMLGGAGGTRIPLAASLTGPLLYAAQEQAEAVGRGSWPCASLLVEPRFLLGLIVQLPFAVLTYLVVHFLLHAASVVHAVLAAATAVPTAAGRRSAGWVPTDRLPPAAPASGPSLGRGPPRRIPRPA